jgi:hypothetical protein
VPKLGPGGRLYFRVVITYNGPFSVDHETSATWEYVERDMNRFIAFRNEKYTYMK